MARLIDTIGTCNLSLRDQGSHFDAIARSIVFQQLSGKRQARFTGDLKDFMVAEVRFHPS